MNLTGRTWTGKGKGEVVLGRVEEGVGGCSDEGSAGVKRLWALSLLSQGAAR